MKKTWYIKIRGRQKGPYTIDQLKSLREVTPDTLVWSVELAAWIPMRDVTELQEIFKDPASDEEEEESDDFLKKEKKLAPELVLEMASPPPLTFWLWVFLVSIAFILLHLLNQR